MVIFEFFHDDGQGGDDKFAGICEIDEEVDSRNDRRYACVSLDEAAANGRARARGHGGRFESLKGRFGKYWCFVYTRDLIIGMKMRCMHMHASDIIFKSIRNLLGNMG